MESAIFVGCDAEVHMTVHGTTDRVKHPKYILTCLENKETQGWHLRPPNYLLVIFQDYIDVNLFEKYLCSQLEVNSYVNFPQRA